LIPGARISEHEVARRLNVSRQPVREAFIRLADLKLIEIRPQRVTIVRRFSVQEIRTARFVRQSVEFEVLRLAVARRNAGDISSMRQNLKQQAKAVDQKNVQQFHALDYQFHQLFCRAAGVAYIHDTITELKSKVDRLCVLGFQDGSTIAELIEDHTDMFHALDQRDEDDMIRAARHHLGRMDAIISRLRMTHADYFDD
ncbi:MAG: GntR family transcriptional regulator, partial [Pseudomonadota bacterium]